MRWFHSWVKLIFSYITRTCLIINIQNNSEEIIVVPSLSKNLNASFNSFFAVSSLLKYELITALNSWKSTVPEWSFLQIQTWKLVYNVTNITLSINFISFLICSLFAFTPKWLITFFNSWIDIVPDLLRSNKSKHSFNSLT